MASNFYTKISSAVGVANTQVGAYAVPALTQTIVLTLSLANITTNAISVSAWYGANSGANTSIVTNAPVPVGGTLVINKQVLQANDKIYVASSAAASIDAIMSVLEIS